METETADTVDFVAAGGGDRGAVREGTGGGI